MSEVWDRFIEAYLKEIPYKTMRQILHAFCYFMAVDLETSDRIMKG